MDRTERLSQEDIEARLKDLPEWSLNFEDFVAAMAFVTRIADLAEDQKHHPDIMIRYNKVTLTVSTHDAGGITEKDFALAGGTDVLVVPS